MQSNLHMTRWLQLSFALRTRAFALCSFSRMHCPLNVDVLPQMASPAWHKESVTTTEAKRALQSKAWASPELVSQLLRDEAEPVTASMLKVWLCFQMVVAWCAAVDCELWAHA